MANDDELLALWRGGESDRVEFKRSPKDMTELHEQVCAFANDLPFDARPVARASIADLDLTLFERVYLPAAVAPEVLEANARTLEQRLAALKLADADGVPTVAGILTLAKTPRWFLPGAYVQFARFDGTDVTAPVLSQHEVDGPIPDLLRSLDELLRINIATRSDITVVPEVRRPDYPLSALQQFAYNAVMHRTYESGNAPARIYWFRDRVEIVSPGGLLGPVTPANVGSGVVTAYRNPLIAEAMKNLGYVQRFGAGLTLASAALNRNGNPPPEFSFPEGHVVVKVRPAA